jgi:hypothetical protein
MKWGVFVRTENIDFQAMRAMEKNNAFERIVEGRNVQDSKLARGAQEEGGGGLGIGNAGAKRENGLVKSRKCVDFVPAVLHDAR